MYRVGRIVNVKTSSCTWTISIVCKYKTTDTDHQKWAQRCHLSEWSTHWGDIAECISMQFIVRSLKTNRACKSQRNSDAFYLNGRRQQNQITFFGKHTRTKLTHMVKANKFLKWVIRIFAFLFQKNHGKVNTVNENRNQTKTIWYSLKKETVWWLLVKNQWESFWNENHQISFEKNVSLNQRKERMFWKA